MRSLRALRGLRALTSTALNDIAEVSTRSLTTVPDLKSVLREKIPEQQVCQAGIEARAPAYKSQNARARSMIKTNYHSPYVYCNLGTELK